MDQAARAAGEKAAAELEPIRRGEGTDRERHTVINRIDPFT